MRLPAPAPPLVPGRPPLWRRRLHRHRRPLLALLAGLLVWSLTAALRPADPARVPVVVAARDLAPGTTVTPDDLVVADVPEQARSVDSTADPTTLVGRRVVVPLLAGDAVLARHLLTASLLAGYGAGTVATPLRLADASALALLRPGDLVDVIAASSVGAAGAASDSATVVASRVRVLLAGTAAASGWWPAVGAVGGRTAVGRAGHDLGPGARDRTRCSRFATQRGAASRVI